MSVPNAVGTTNATEDVFLHVKPGRERAFILRYFRFNLPKLTKALLCAILAALGVASFIVAHSSFPPFAQAELVLYTISALAVVLCLIALLTRFTAWYWGSALSVCALLVYAVGVAHHAPFVWNGASVELAATWNCIAFSAVAYLLVHAMVAYGILVVWPNSQGFTD